MPSFPLSVLVLEDHAFQRAVAVSMLRQLGCAAVYEAKDGAEAIALLEVVGSVDITICDLQMEGMDGLAFIQHVAASGQVGSIIISSSLSADLRRTVRQIVSLLGLEFLGDLAKPLKMESLNELLKKRLNVRCINSDGPKATPEMASEAQVRHAITHDQFKAYYQPKFNLSNGEVCGVEVLARWQQPGNGIVSPANFIPTLARCGLMTDLLFLQMEHALQVQKQALSRGFSLNMAFNLDSSQLASSELISTIKQLLLRHMVSGSGLTFEVTETGLLEAPAISLENLVRLRMMGCRLSIDDFGAGFSSLQRLCQLPFNEIKIDAVFVRNLEHEPRCEAIISSTLALGKTLNMSVVIEGIETEAQCMKLIEMGCVQGQGYWYARPMTGDALMGWL